MFDKTEFAEKVTTLFAAIVAYMMPFILMLEVAAGFVILSFALEVWSLKKSGERYGFFRSLWTLLKRLAGHGLFVFVFYNLDKRVLIPHVYPQLKTYLGVNLDYVATVIILLGICWWHFKRADKYITEEYGKGIEDSIGDFFISLIRGVKKIKELFKKNEDTSDSSEEY